MDQQIQNCKYFSKKDKGLYADDAGLTIIKKAQKSQRKIYSRQDADDGSFRKIWETDKLVFKNERRVLGGTNCKILNNNNFYKNNKFLKFTNSGLKN